MCFAYLQKVFLNTHGICNVEINKDQPNEKSEGYLFRVCYSKGLGHIDCILAEPQRQVEEYIMEAKEGFGHSRLEAVGTGQTAGGRPTAGHPMGLVGEAYLAFSGWS